MLIIRISLIYFWFLLLFPLVNTLIITFFVRDRWILSGEFVRVFLSLVHSFVSLRLNPWQNLNFHNSNRLIPDKLIPLPSLLMPNCLRAVGIGEEINSMTHSSWNHMRLPGRMRMRVPISSSGTRTPSATLWHLWYGQGEVSNCHMIGQEKEKVLSAESHYPDQRKNSKAFQEKRKAQIDRNQDRT